MRVASSRSMLTLSAMLMASEASASDLTQDVEVVSQLQKSRQVEMPDGRPVDLAQMHSERFETPKDFFERKAAQSHPGLEFSQLSSGTAQADVQVHERFETKEDAPIIVSSCDQIGKAQNEWEEQRNDALKDLCSDPQFASMFEATLDPAFKEQYKKHYGADGWTENAWVNFVGVQGHNDKWGLLTKKMAESVRRASEHPLVIVTFGDIPLTDIPSKAFPNVVIFRAKGIPRDMGENHFPVSFNFNKLRAMLMAKVKTGFSLDGDMLMVTKKADRLLQRAREEITKDYPFPMMPTHFLDRDPRDEHISGWREGQSNFLTYTCDGCPDPTMRWGQAQPAWTYWSLPFISRWLGAKLRGVSHQGVNVPSIGEDEDLLNVALWVEGATKSWCQFQPAADFHWIEDHLIPQEGFGPLNLGYDDPHYFPEGVPMGLLFFHGHKEIEDYEGALKVLEEKASEVDSAKPIVFNEKYYESYAEMKKDHPNLNCML